jgi:hypothetical protein
MEFFFEIWPFEDGHDLFTSLLGTLHTLRQSMLFHSETFEKCSILFKVKEGENSNRRNAL